VVSPNENNRRTAALRTLASTPPPAGTNIILVSHKPNIMDAFGKDWFDVREGEASIFRPDGKGGFVLVGRVQGADWPRLAQANPLRADVSAATLTLRPGHDEKADRRPTLNGGL
jgi:hypothetical protein